MAKAMPAIDAKTQVCALIGHPVGHSLSPAIHNAAFEALSLPYVYVAHDVLPDRVSEAVAGVRAFGYRGLSITIPHKVSAMQHVDEVEPTARRIGCINTIVNDAGRLKGYNSDGRGAIQALREAGCDPAAKHVVVLGSGGAARAIAMTLAAEAPPSRVVILGVVPDELERLGNDVAAIGSCEVIPHQLDEASLAEQLERAEVLLQCTPIGMHPDEEQTLVSPARLRRGLTVFDAVYNPRRTRLLKDAEAAGCRTVEGVRMFLRQAVVQFELWTGRDAPVDVMGRVLEERL